jgi:hypothetical protein
VASGIAALGSVEAFILQGTFVSKRSRRNGGEGEQRCHKGIGYARGILKRTE